MTGRLRELADGVSVLVALAFVLLLVGLMEGTRLLLVLLGLALAPAAFVAGLVAAMLAGLWVWVFGGRAESPGKGGGE